MRSALNIPPHTTRTRPASQQQQQQQTNSAFLRVSNRDWIVRDGRKWCDAYGMCLSTRAPPNTMHNTCSANAILHLHTCGWWLRAIDPSHNYEMHAQIYIAGPACVVEFIKLLITCDDGIYQVCESALRCSLSKRIRSCHSIQYTYHRQLGWKNVWLICMQRAATHDHHFTVIHQILIIIRFIMIPLHTGDARFIRIYQPPSSWQCQSRTMHSTSFN